MSFVDPTTGWFGTNHGEILHTVDGGVTWRRQQSGTQWAITSIYFNDTMKGWAAGTNQIVLQTFDGGAHWCVQNVPAPTPAMLTDMHFADAYTGWIATTMLASSAIQTTSPLLRTTNAGFAWSVQGQVPEIHVTSLHFMNRTTGWAIGMHGIWYTHDAGESWSCKYEGSTDPLVGLSFVDEANGWALGFGGTVLRYRMN